MEKSGNAYGSSGVNNRSRPSFETRGTGWDASSAGREAFGSKGGGDRVGLGKSGEAKGTQSGNAWRQREARRRRVRAGKGGAAAERNRHRWRNRVRTMEKKRARVRSRHNKRLKRLEAGADKARAQGDTAAISRYQHRIRKARHNQVRQMKQFEARYERLLSQGRGLGISDPTAPQPHFPVPPPPPAPAPVPAPGS